MALVFLLRRVNAAWLLAGAALLGLAAALR